MTRLRTTDELLDPNTVKVDPGSSGTVSVFFTVADPVRPRYHAGGTCGHATRCTATSALYVYRRDFLLRYAAMEQTALEQAEKLEQLRILEHGYSIHAAITTHESIAVDTPADLERVRALLGTHA